MFSIQSDNWTPNVHILDIFLFAAELEEPKKLPYEVKD